MCNIVVGRLTGAKEKDKFLINLSFIEGNENSHRIIETIQVVLVVICYQTWKLMHSSQLANLCWIPPEARTTEALGHRRWVAYSNLFTNLHSIYGSIMMWTYKEINQQFLILIFRCPGSLRCQLHEKSRKTSKELDWKFSSHYMLGTFVAPCCRKHS